MLVQPGTFLNYNAQTSDSLTQNGEDIVGKVTGILQPQGIFVQAHQINSPGAISQIETLALSSFSIPIKVLMTVETDPNGDSYASEDDVRSIIDNAFWQIVGALPSSTVAVGSTPKVTAPPAPGVTPNYSGFFDCMSQGGALGDCFSSLFSNLGTGTSFVIIGIIVLVVIILAVSLFPESPARVVRSFA